MLLKLQKSTQTSTLIIVFKSGHLTEGTGLSRHVADVNMNVSVWLEVNNIACFKFTVACELYPAWRGAPAESKRKEQVKEILTKKSLLLKH